MDFRVEHTNAYNALLDIWEGLYVYSSLPPIHVRTLIQSEAERLPTVEHLCQFCLHQTMCLRVENATVASSLLGECVRLR